MPETCNFIKERPWHRCFPVNFVKFLTTPFSQNTFGRLLLNTYTKLISCQCNIFHYRESLAFVNLFFDRFSIMTQLSQSNQEQYSACCSWPCFRISLCTHHAPLQCFSTYFRNPDYVISCD